MKKTLAELEKIVKEHGGAFAKTVTKNVDILVPRASGTPPPAVPYINQKPNYIHITLLCA